MSRMMRNAVRMGGDDEEGVDLRKAVSCFAVESVDERWLTGWNLQLAQTLLDQAHLAPLPLTVRPILWGYDHALRLYPMPTTVSRTRR